MSPVPSIDAEIGISLYATSFAGLGSGYGIRATPDDFAVYEILSQKTLHLLTCRHNDDNPGNMQRNIPDAADDLQSPTVLDAQAQKKNGYAVYLLKKRGIDTVHALSTIYQMTGARLKSLGLKDASATTTQYVCSVGANKRLQDITAPKFSLEFAGYAKKPLTGKQMLGNRFRIRITGDWSDMDNDADRSPARFEEHGKIPNFYGYQRFGSRRPVTHLVGRAVIKRDFDEAVRLILEFDSEYDTAARREMRRNLADPCAYARSIKRLPSGMDTERLVLGELDAHGDPLRAFRAIPLQLRRLYVSAYQSYLFNCVLSIAIERDEDLSAPIRGDVCFDRDGKLVKYDKGSRGLLADAVDATATTATTVGTGGASITPHGSHNNAIRFNPYSVTIPIVGYSYYAKTRFAPYVSCVLEDESVSPKDFFIKEMQEISGEGGFRDAIMQCSKYMWNHDGKTVSFSLARGSFATMLLREIIKPPDPIASGF